MSTVGWEPIACNLCGLTHQAQPYCTVPSEQAGPITLVRCAQCGLIYMNPRPTVSAMANLYGETYYAYDGLPGTEYHALKWRFFRAMAETHGGYPPSTPQPRVLHWLKKLLTWPLYAKFPNVPPARAGGTLLDIGCATGEYLGFMQELGWAVHGVEVGARAAAFARDQRGLDVHTGDLSSATFDSASFDVVTLWYVLEHVHDPLATLREAVRVTKPGGVLAVAVPNIGSIIARLTAESWHGMQPPFHLHFFTPETLAKYLGLVGLRVMSLTTYSSPHGLFVSGEQMLSKRTGISHHKLYRTFRPVEMLALPATLVVDAFGQGDTMLVWARNA